MFNILPCPCGHTPEEADGKENYTEIEAEQCHPDLYFKDGLSPEGASHYHTYRYVNELLFSPYNHPRPFSVRYRK